MTNRYGDTSKARCSEHIGTAWAPRCADCDREAVEEANDLVQERLTRHPRGTASDRLRELSKLGYPPAADFGGAIAGRDDDAGVR